MWAVGYYAHWCRFLSIISQIGLQIPYAPAFFPSNLPISLSNLAFERAAVLFNLAALYSQLAVAEDRSNREGVRRASAYYQVYRASVTYLKMLTFSPP